MYMCQRDGDRDRERQRRKRRERGEERDLLQVLGLCDCGGWLGKFGICRLASGDFLAGTEAAIHRQNFFFLRETCFILNAFQQLYQVHLYYLG